MKLPENFKQKVKIRKFIFGFFIFLITYILCILIFRNWDTMKTFLFGSI